MSDAQGQVLLLIGSAKKLHTSTSESLGSYLLDRLREGGFDTQSLYLHQSLRTDEANDALHAAVGRADIVVLAFPTYIDCLPYLVIKALEQIAARGRATAHPKRQQLLAITNCGFPEAHQTDTALAICRQFARETGFQWAGGLGLGGGGVIGGRLLGEAGGLVRHVVRALDLTADSLAAGQPVPDEAVALMAKPLVAPWLFRIVGGLGWRRRAKRFGARKRLCDRPFDPLRDEAAGRPDRGDTEYPLKNKARNAGSGPCDW